MTAEPVVRQSTSNSDANLPNPNGQSSEATISKPIPPVQVVEVARAELAENFRTDSIETLIPQIDQLFNLEYETYLGVGPLSGEASLDTIQSTLDKVTQATGQNIAVVYILLQAASLEVSVVTAEGTIRQTVPVSRATVIEIANQFLTAVTSPRKLSTDSYRPFAEQLYQWMIAPIESELQAQEINTLMFAMDRQLRGLPVAAFYDGEQEQFLIQKYSLSLIPSFSLTDTRYQPIKNPRVLAMGASVFPESDEEELPAVPLELKVITETTQDNEKYFLNEEFTLENFRKQRLAKPYDIVHLATHSEFRRGNPRTNNYILFWDGRVTIDELQGLDWKWGNSSLNLLILSACRTAIGDEGAEMGFAGLAVQTGIPSVLASLWYVSDIGTLGLMAEFYQQLQTIPIKAEAFRQAQIAMLSGQIRIESNDLVVSDIVGIIPLTPEIPRQANNNFSHPYYWSGFTIIGSPW
ncbi:MAG: CHAT domain-containing protein [Oscillatoriales cyanobacterium RM2_1_1]|nr:CHAT domain-containing protein [Oscillatoriales cyanobacterium RM2_1_1]